MSARDGEEVGSCSSCGQTFGYRLIHNGFNDSAFAYCDSCGMTALFSLWSQSIPAGIDLKVHGPIDAELEPAIALCSCAGRFRANAVPRCPRCRLELDPIACAQFIERDAPGTAKGWRWQRSWRGLYAIIVDQHSVSDPWKNAPMA